jgi:hypothetical protein
MEFSMEFSMESHGKISWKKFLNVFVEFNSMEFHETEFDGIPWNSMEFHGIP